MAPASSLTAEDGPCGQDESYDAYEVFSALADVNGILHGINRALGNGAHGTSDGSESAVSVCSTAKHSAADVDPAWKGVKLDRASTQAALDDMRSMIEDAEESMNKMNEEHLQKWRKKLYPSASDKSTSDLYPIIHESGFSPMVRDNQWQLASSEGSVRPEIKKIFGDDLIKRSSVMKTGLKHARNMLSTSHGGDQDSSDLHKVEFSSDPLHVSSGAKSIFEADKKVDSAGSCPGSDDVPMYFDSRLSMPEWMAMNKGWFEGDRRRANSERKHQDVMHTLKHGFTRWLEDFRSEGDSTDEDKEHETVMARIARDSARSTRKHKIEMARIAKSSARDTREHAEIMAKSAEDSTRDTWKCRVRMARIAEDSARDSWVHEIEIDRIAEKHELRMDLIDQGVY